MQPELGLTLGDREGNDALWGQVRVGGTLALSLTELVLSAPRFQQLRPPKVQELCTPAAKVAAQESSVAQAPGCRVSGGCPFVSAG